MTDDHIAVSSGALAREHRICAWHLTRVFACVADLDDAVAQRWGQVRSSTSSSTNLLPKNASRSSAMATSVQRTALLPRQP